MAFEASWLELREPADHAARDATLLENAAQFACNTPVLVDLGTGTGSTVRAFGDKLPDAHWRLVDSDAALLEIAAGNHPEAQTACMDLADLTTLPLEDGALVTASALFDLMPRDWLESLADILTASKIGLYAALNYDGKMSWEPALIEDTLVTKSFNDHQRGDKGLGPAMGPQSAAAIIEIFEERGYKVTTAPSPWQLGPNEAELQRQLVKGITEAAMETGSPFAQNWGYARFAACGSASCTVGHVDVLALPS